MRAARRPALSLLALVTAPYLVVRHRRSSHTAADQHHYRMTSLAGAAALGNRRSVLHPLGDIDLAVAANEPWRM
jgi:hypothetical protein